MTKDWARDIHNMHTLYGFHGKVKDFDADMLSSLMSFRAKFIEEELTELKNAIKANDAEEIVDALIDICVVAIGTLDLAKVDAHKAWDEIFRCNCNKKVGIKESRPNPFGLPDLIKPEGWEGPSHINNHGTLSKLEKRKE